MKAFKFKLYKHKRNKHLRNQIELASEIYNHCIALHKRYYHRYGKYLNLYQLKKHITKLKKLSQYAHWNNLGSQAIQDVVIRIDKAYKLFFSERKKGNKKINPPTFKKRRKYKSFTLTQAGYKLLKGNAIRIGKYTYRYFKSREIEGNIKTVTIKRDRVGDLYIVFVTDYETTPEVVSPTGKIVGFDFGLKTYLTASDGNDIQSQLFFKQGQKEIQKANKRLSLKQKGSNNRHKAHQHLAKVHHQIANQRNDFQWKLANQLTSEYDVLCFENLNLKGMQTLWGKKVNDLAFYSLVAKVKYIAAVKGKTVHCIDRFYPSSKTCSHCGYIHQKLQLRDRFWQCPNCARYLNRDKNAALNIKRVGTSTLGGGNVRPAITVGSH